MHWYDPDTTTSEDLHDLYRKTNFDAIVAPDVLYYPEYRSAIAEFLSKHKLKCYGVMNVYSNLTHHTYIDSTTGSYAVQWDKADGDNWNFRPCDNGTVY